MKPTYLIHSAKGTTWTKHKYLKKVGNKYIYATEKVSSTDISNEAENVMSGKYKGQNLQEVLGSKYGLVTSSIASKFKKPSSSGSSSSSKSSSSSSSSGSSSSSKSSSSSSSSKSSSSSSSSKSSSSSSSSDDEEESTSSSSSSDTTSESTNSEETETSDDSSSEETETSDDSSSEETETSDDSSSEEKSDDSEESNTKLKSAISSAVTLGDNDKFIATQNDDGTIVINITYEDGATQTINLNSDYEVTSKTDKEVKHLDNTGIYFWNQDDGFYHHGIAGQKWGHKNGPPYPLDEGDHSKAELKAIKSNRKATISRGTQLYRISTKKSDLGKDKIYATVDKKQGDFYKSTFALSDIVKSGEAYVQELTVKNDLYFPDKKTMEKIELNLLKDKDVQKELVDSLMKKGLSRVQATEQVQPYSRGKAFVEKATSFAGGVATTAGMGGISAFSMLMGQPVMSIYAGALGVGAAAVTVSALAEDSNEKKRALNATRVSYGDKNNKITNQKLQEVLAAKGYNAMKDYNDRRAFGKNANSAIIVMDSEKNLSSKSHKMTAQEYGEIYADNKMKENKENGVKVSISRDDYVKDGIAKFKSTEDNYLISKARKEENAKLLEEAKKKKE